MSAPGAQEGRAKVAFLFFFSHEFVSRQVVDTSRVFPHPAGPAKCKSLKALAKEFLNREFQQREGGHDSREDALAALDLMKLKS